MKSKLLITLMILACAHAHAAEQSPARTPWNGQMAAEAQKQYLASAWLAQQIQEFRKCMARLERLRQSQFVPINGQEANHRNDPFVQELIEGRKQMRENPPVITHHAAAAIIEHPGRKK